MGESVNFIGGQEWLKENGFTIIDLHSEECISLLGSYIRNHPEIWNEDIGVAE
jgi:cytosine deaminase